MLFFHRIGLSPSNFLLTIRGLLNISLRQQIKTPDEPRIVRGRECSKKFVPQGRSHFDARSVLIVREHGKKARTPLAAFFNIPIRLALIVTLTVHVGMGMQASAWGQDIVILKSADVGPYNTAASSFKETFSLEVQILEYDLQGDLAQGRKLGRKIRASPAKLVVAIGLKAALAAKLEILDIPIISCMVLAPSKYDLTRDNMTGVGLQIPIKNQFALIQSLVPDLKRIGVLFDPTKTEHTVQEAKALAKKQGLQLIDRPVSSPQDVPAMLRSLLPNIDVLWLIPDSTVLTEDSLDFLLSTTLDAGIPVFGFSSGLVRSGALAGLYINYSNVGKQVAGLAGKLLKGESIPQGTLLPPEHVSLAINRQIAQYLGITVPPQQLADAEEVY